MACNDTLTFTFEPVRTGAIYKLTVEGPPGTFTLAPVHHEAKGGSHPVVMTGCPVTSPSGLDVVFVAVNIVSPTPVTVKVQATVTDVPETYCREITGGFSNPRDHYASPANRLIVCRPTRRSR